MSERLQIAEESRIQKNEPSKKWKEHITKSAFLVN